MGLDVTIVISGHYKLPERFAKDFAYLMYPSCPPEQVGSMREDETGQRITVFDCTERYYGPGYERGSWPKIAGVLAMFTRLYLPVPEMIWYQSDAELSDGRMREVSADMVNEFWAHYLGPNGDAYYAR